MAARRGPSPKTVWVPRLYKCHAVQWAAASRTVARLDVSGGCAGRAYSSVFIGFFNYKSKCVLRTYVTGGTHCPQRVGTKSRGSAARSAPAAIDIVFGETDSPVNRS